MSVLGRPCCVALAQQDREGLAALRYRYIVAPCTLLPSRVVIDASRRDQLGRRSVKEPIKSVGWHLQP